MSSSRNSDSRSVDKMSLSKSGSNKIAENSSTKSRADLTHSRPSARRVVDASGGNLGSHQGNSSSLSRADLTHSRPSARRVVHSLRRNPISNSPSSRAHMIHSGPSARRVVDSSGGIVSSNNGNSPRSRADLTHQSSSTARSVDRSIAGSSGGNLSSHHGTSPSRDPFTALLRQLSALHKHQIHKLEHIQEAMRRKLNKALNSMQINADYARDYYIRNKQLEEENARLRKRLAELGCHQKLYKDDDNDLIAEEAYPGQTEQDHTQVDEKETDSFQHQTNKPAKVNKLTKGKTSKKIRYTELDALPTEATQEASTHHRGGMKSRRKELLDAKYQDDIHEMPQSSSKSKTSYLTDEIQGRSTNENYMSEPAQTLVPETCNPSLEMESSDDPYGGGDNRWIKQREVVSVPETLAPFQEIDSSDESEFDPPTYASTPQYQSSHQMDDFETPSQRLQDGTPKSGSSPELNRRDIALAVGHVDFQKEDIEADYDETHFVTQDLHEIKENTSPIPKSESQYPVDFMNTQVPSPTFCGGRDDDEEELVEELEKQEVLVKGENRKAHKTPSHDGRNGSIKTPQGIVGNDGRNRSFKTPQSIVSNDESYQSEASMLLLQGPSGTITPEHAKAQTPTHSKVQTPQHFKVPKPEHSKIQTPEHFKYQTPEHSKAQADGKIKSTTSNWKPNPRKRKLLPDDSFDDVGYEDARNDDDLKGKVSNGQHHYDHVDDEYHEDEGGGDDLTDEVPKGQHHDDEYHDHADTKSNDKSTSRRHNGSSRNRKDIGIDLTNDETVLDDDKEQGSSIRSRMGKKRKSNAKKGHSTNDETPLDGDKEQNLHIRTGKEGYHPEDRHPVDDETMLNASDIPNKENSPPPDDLPPQKTPPWNSSRKYKLEISRVSSKGTKNLKQSKLSPSMFQSKNRAHNSSMVAQYNGTGKMNLDSQRDESLSKAIELSLLASIDVDSETAVEARNDFKIPNLPRKKKTPKRGIEQIDRSLNQAGSTIKSNSISRSAIDSDDVVFDVIDDNDGERNSKLSRKKRRAYRDAGVSSENKAVRREKQTLEERKEDARFEDEDDKNNSCADLFGDEEDHGDDDVEMVSKEDEDESRDTSFKRGANQSMGTLQIVQEFDRLPKPEEPGYKYVDIVRKKEERQRLKAFDCKQCEDFYSDMKLTDEEKAERMKACSRHRGHFSPPNTPEHYWSVGFPDTQTCLQRGYMQVTEDTDEPNRKRGTNKYKQLF